MMANGAAIQIKFESLFYFQARNINLSFYLPLSEPAGRFTNSWCGRLEVSEALEVTIPFDLSGSL
jgi:hypothetical protein